jgi:hypothetical protein
MRTLFQERYPHSYWQTPPGPAHNRSAAKLDRATARAMVDAGYMALRSYIEQFGFDDPPGEGEVVEGGGSRSAFH